MLECFSEETKGAIPLTVFGPDDWQREGTSQNWLQAAGFAGETGQCVLLPGENGSLAGVAVGLSQSSDMLALAAVSDKLPPGTYRLEGDYDKSQAYYWALGFAMERYHFNYYQKPQAQEVKLCYPEGADGDKLRETLRAIYLIRDLINTPASDMSPEHLSQIARGIAEAYGAEYRDFVGEQLLTNNFPAIYHVGKASEVPPRLIDFSWGKTSHPQLTLVGKGVCFDSGGLNIKSASGMRHMKKDMGGAAHVLGVAQYIMARNLPVRLRVLVPAVENAIAGNAYRPGDIIKMRDGQQVEIDNTDAEGRMILADALSLAAADKPDWLIDFATLTGAARVAVGTDIACYFTNDEVFANAIQSSSECVNDPMWRLPLHEPYRKLLKSKVADMCNSAPGGYAGAITAALFLSSFVLGAKSWCHIDLMAWNPTAHPAHPEGGEAMAVRAFWDWLENNLIAH